MIDEIDHAIQASATEFVAAIFADGWRGREREAVSLYAIGCLIRQCRSGTALHAPTQVAVEATVPGVPGLNPKGRVNKDLVIWARPAQTCWDDSWAPVQAPLAVLEWKVFRKETMKPTFSSHDIQWLQHFSVDRPAFVGYSVCLDLAARGSRMAVARVYRGASDRNWLRL